ncbi:hypothetical protein COT97_00810 [Candidatus Falkowbacteria bacterium CG10_big_fil_rev_8_21_14_0_10_39_11]|uniref:Uncharacterized protein n=1 Tax=Candidatus Falkowbacteria bacterium CG10_big_fil_rev_8_21_14_0_10_39_11 TaxID=1974565 RepID=A0A2H0V636_9BACT|nr:MAG: hypothetical protein COT97_00810 [Candidatus Falkowbacteria bacterium CG10_big_fil_rev_8_21_14_0_10_39_11]
MFWTRKKIITTIVILAVLITGITIFYLWKNKTPDGSIDQGPGSVSQKRVLQYQAPELTLAEKNEREISNISRSFAERFGTASSQLQENILAEISSSMTDSFYRWATNKYQASLQSELGDSYSYSSITTKALAIEVVDLQADTAKVIIETQREKITAGKETVNYKQKIKLDLVKVDSLWKVDGAYWQ